jgi:hypothetical protein
VAAVRVAFVVSFLGVVPCSGQKSEEEGIEKLD